MTMKPLDITGASSFPHRKMASEQQAPLPGVVSGNDELEAAPDITRGWKFIDQAREIHKKYPLFDGHNGERV